MSAIATKMGIDDAAIAAAKPVSKKAAAKQKIDNDKSIVNELSKDFSDRIVVLTADYAGASAGGFKKVMKQQNTVTVCNEKLVEKWATAVEKKLTRVEEAEWQKITEPQKVILYHHFAKKLSEAADSLQAEKDKAGGETEGGARPKKKRKADKAPPTPGSPNPEAADTSFDGTNERDAFMSLDGTFDTLRIGDRRPSTTSTTATPPVKNPLGNRGHIYSSSPSRSAFSGPSGPSYFGSHTSSPAVSQASSQRSRALPVRPKTSARLTPDKPEMSADVKRAVSFALFATEIPVKVHGPDDEASYAPKPKGRVADDGECEEEEEEEADDEDEASSVNSARSVDSLKTMLRAPGVLGSGAAH